MLYFENDYAEGAHPAVLERLLATNLDRQPGYGSDAYCEAARQKIRLACGCPAGEVYFLAGGTQTNAVVIGSLLRRQEGVLAAQTGHVSLHEAGAIEYTGHKVLELPQREGKLAAAEIRRYLEIFYADQNHEQMVRPGMVYLSHPTEYGTLYSREELAAIAGVCREYALPLFLDGARLGYGLASPASDLTLKDIAALCSVFYIGGTKVGALCGEAVVFPRPAIAPPHFTALIKQQGALLAKGRLLGVQFDALFTDNLYLKLGQQALAAAERLKEGLRDKDYRFLLDSPTNQIFVILANRRLEELRHQVRFGFWERYDEEHTVVRFATSWATEIADVEQLIELL